MPAVLTKICKFLLDSAFFEANRHHLRCTTVRLKIRDLHNRVPPRKYELILRGWPRKFMERFFVITSPWEVKFAGLNIVYSRAWNFSLRFDLNLYMVVPGATSEPTWIQSLDNIWYNFRSLTEVWRETSCPWIQSDRFSERRPFPMFKMTMEKTFKNNSWEDFLQMKLSVLSARIHLLEALWSTSGRGCRVCNQATRDFRLDSNFTHRYTRTTHHAIVFSSLAGFLLLSVFETFLATPTLHSTQQQRPHMSLGIGCFSASDLIPPSNWVTNLLSAQMQNTTLPWQWVN